MMVNICRSINLLNPALIHNSNTMRYSHCFNLVMGYINHRRLEHFMDFYQLGTCLLAQLGVQIG